MTTTHRCGGWMAAAMIASAVNLAGCVTQPELTAEGRSQVDALLTDGASTRADLILHFGQPSQRFENDRILSWLLHITEDGELAAQILEHDATQPIRWTGISHNLVVVFDSAGHVSRHSLIPTSNFQQKDHDEEAAE